MSPSTPTTTPVGRRLVTQEQAARYTLKTTRTIRRWLGEGYLTGYRVGPRSILVDLNEIERLFRTMPGKARDGRKPYGPKSRIVNLAQSVTDQPEQDR